MTSYHIRDGRRTAGEFLAHSLQEAGEEVGCTVVLTWAERERKRRMLACYASQRDVLRDFPLEPERLRAAPRYDFFRPPHPGQLWYEYLGWPMTWAKWRERAGRFLQGTGKCA
jgi:N-acetylglucosamine malate deacetylase 2